MLRLITALLKVGHGQTGRSPSDAASVSPRIGALTHTCWHIKALVTQVAGYVTSFKVCVATY
jgi:hypothetical protein